MIIQVKGRMKFFISCRVYIPNKRYETIRSIAIRAYNLAVRRFGSENAVIIAMDLDPSPDGYRWIYLSFPRVVGQSTEYYRIYRQFLDEIMKGLPDISNKKKRFTALATAEKCAIRIPDKDVGYYVAIYDCYGLSVGIASFLPELFMKIAK